MHDPAPEPLTLPRDLAETLYRALGQALGHPDDTDMTETDIDQAMDTGTPVQLTGPPPGLVAALQDVLGRFIPAVNVSSQQVTGHVLNFPYAVTVEDFTRWTTALEDAKRNPLAWMPPPPGDTREQLPDGILALLVRRPYLSTACEMAKACTSAVVRYPDQMQELTYWARWLHGKRCRINNKYSGELCNCHCHEDRQEATP